jgi:hypothetical protein
VEVRVLSTAPNNKSPTLHDECGAFLSGYVSRFPKLGFNLTASLLKPHGYGLLITYAAVPTADGVPPSLYAIALMVSLEATRTLPS